MNPTVRFLALGFFYSHIPATLCFDAQVRHVYCTTLLRLVDHRRSSSVASFHLRSRLPTPGTSFRLVNDDGAHETSSRWVASFNDPLLGPTTPAPWFASFIWLEVLFQLPCFFAMIYGLQKSAFPS